MDKDRDTDRQTYGKQQQQQVLLELANVNSTREGGESVP